MRKIKQLVLSLAASAIIIQTAYAQQSVDKSKDPEPTPIKMYKIKEGFLTTFDVIRMNHFMKQLNDKLLMADPTPQPSINYNIVVPPVPKYQVYKLIDAGFSIDIRSSCDLIKDGFTDRYGNIINGGFVYDAIECGCAMIQNGYHVFEAQRVANLVRYSNNPVQTCPVPY